MRANRKYQISYRVRLETLQALKAKAKEQGKTETEVLEAAIRAWCEPRPEPRREEEESEPEVIAEAGVMQPEGVPEGKVETSLTALKKKPLWMNEATWKALKGKK